MKSVAIIIFLLVCCAGWYAFTAKASTGTTKAATVPASEEKGIPVTAATVLSQNVPVYIDGGLGTVIAYNAVTIRTQINGQLIKVAFTEGQEIRKGQLLVQIDPMPYQAQLDEAKAKKLQDEAKVGQDQAKVNQDEAKIKQDTATQAKDQANLDNARLDLKRDETAGDAIAEQTTGDQRALVKQLEAQIQADIAAIQADAAAKKADEAAVQSDIATVQVDEASIQYQQVLLNYTTITSPLDGVIGIRYVDQGNFVQTTDQTGIALITQIHPISLIVPLPQKELKWISERMPKAKLPVLAMDADNSKLQLDSGVLDYVDNAIDPTTRTFKIKATFNNPGNKLWPGLFVNARVLLDTLPEATVVDAAALQQGPDGSFAYVIKEDQTVEDRAVKIVQVYGRTMLQDGLAVIESGLKPDEKVVLTGQDRLKKGSKVEVHVPKAAPAAGAGENPPVVSPGTGSNK
jgi:multidrug efflux system membrane fusion protein